MQEGYRMTVEPLPSAAAAAHSNHIQASVPHVEATSASTPSSASSGVKQRTLSQDYTERDPEWTPGSGCHGHSVGLTPPRGGHALKAPVPKAFPPHRPSFSRDTSRDGAAARTRQLPWWRRNFRVLWKVGLALCVMLALRQLFPADGMVRLRMYTVSLGTWLQRPENLYDGGCITVIILAIATVLSLPIIPIELFIGKVYGFPTWTAFLLGTLGKQSGSVASFYFGRLACQGLMQRTMKQYPVLEQLEDAMFDRALECKILFLARSMYGVPAVVKNQFMGALSGTSFAAFFWTALVGDMPHTAFWLYLGAQAESLAAIAEGRTKHGTQKGMVLGLTLFLIATFVCTLHYSTAAFHSTVGELRGSKSEADAGRGAAAHARVPLADEHRDREDGALGPGAHPPDDHV
eukprot:g4309.t1